MTGILPDKRSWTDAQLTAAVEKSHSWRGVMRELGLCVTSAGAIRSVRQHVDRLGISTSHFTGQRRWSDAQLRKAVVHASSWDDVATELGLSTGHGDERTRIKAHAMRLGLDMTRLNQPSADVTIQLQLKPDLRYLRDAGSSIAAMWFQLCGYNVSVPLEPAEYDLLISAPDGIKRVQVKTTTHYDRGWLVQVGRRPYSLGNKGSLVPYDPDHLDYFFLLDGDLTMYVIPSRVIAGRVSILLHNYSRYAVGSAAFLMKCSWPAA